MHRRICAFAGVFMLSTATSAFAVTQAQITEILTDDMGDRPTYIEIFYEGSGSFDLVILNASHDRERRINRIFRISPPPHRDTVVLHEGTWPNDGGLAHAIHTDSSLSLDLLPFGTARRFLIFNETTPFDENTSLPFEENWPATLKVLDTISLSIAGSESDLARDVVPLTEAADNAIIRMDFGQAVWRINNAGSYTDRFISGSTNPQLEFAGGAGRLDPGIPNRPIIAHMPEPHSAILALALISQLIYRRPGVMR